MSLIHIKENEFLPSPGGVAGASSVQPGYGTHSSPDASQNPTHFATGDTIGTHSNTAKKVPDTSRIGKLIRSIYSKPNPPSPDEIKAAFDRVEGDQIKKDPLAAKLEVLEKMAKDPNAYRGLQDMNIDDKTMMNNVTENKHPNDSPARLKINGNVEETKKIFAEMAQGRDKKYVVNSGISDVMKQMWEQKKNRKM